jgi:hypothetical protein
MRNIYYTFWVNAIVEGRKNQPKRTDWKISLFLLITTCNSLNLFVIMLWLKYFDIFSFRINSDFLSVTILNNTMEYILRFGTPFILLNYFLIFHKNRYEKLIEKYPPDDSNCPLFYVITSALGAFISVIIYGLFTH